MHNWYLERGRIDDRPRCSCTAGDRLMDRPLGLQSGHVSGSMSTTSHSRCFYSISQVRVVFFTYSIQWKTKKKKQVRMYYRSGTDGRCCINAGRRFVVTHQVTALFSEKWRHGRHLESVTSHRKSDSLIDAYLLEEHSCQISSRSDVKRRSLRRFWRDRPNKKNNKKNKMSSNVRSVPDPAVSLSLMPAWEKLIYFLWTAKPTFYTVIYRSLLARPPRLWASSAIILVCCLDVQSL